MFTSDTFAVSDLFSEWFTVEISKISELDDRFGILATITFEGNNFEFPLCDLDVTDKKSPNYQYINDYTVWFANR